MMGGIGNFLARTDAVGVAVAALLLALSVAAWVVILWKAWVLRRATADIARAVPAFWEAASLAAGLAFLSIGSDIGGSNRSPASLSGNPSLSQSSSERMTSTSEKR